MNKTIVIVSTLDTKAEETKYLREQIEKLGSNVLIIDVGTGGQPAMPGDVTREEVLAAADPGVSFKDLEGDRPRLSQLMVAGGGKKARELYELNRLDGIVGIGGATSSLMATGVMSALPFGVPKLMVSSVAAARGLATRYFGTSDISIMHSVIDFTTLSDLMNDVLDRAAGSIVGMAMVEREYVATASGDADKQIKPRVAMTLLSFCEKCATHLWEHMEKEGYQVIGYSAAGADKAMEEMIEKEGIFSAVVDLAPGAVGEELFGGTRAAGPHRMEAAGNAGIPQVIAPCIVNLMTPPKTRYKPEYYERKRYDLDKYRSYIRLSPAELVTVAQEFAKKLNQAKGPVKVVIPNKGWSGIDGEGTVLYDPEEDRIFVEELKKQLRDDIEVKEVEANMEDPLFAEEVLKAFRGAMSAL